MNATRDITATDLVDILTTNRRFLVGSIVANNPRAVAEALELPDKISADDLTDLVLAMDEEEQELALNVPYVHGTNALMDEAFDMMLQATRERGIDEPQGRETKLITAVVMGLGALASTYAGAQSDKQRREAEENAAAMEAQAAYNASQAAAAKKKAVTEGLKKAAPWVAGALVLILLAVYKLMQK